MLLLSEITESLKNNYTISLNEENKITQKNSNIDFAEDSKESKKLRDKILNLTKVKKYLAGQEIKKFIYIKNKIISIVV